MRYGEGRGREDDGRRDGVGVRGKGHREGMQRKKEDVRLYEEEEREGFERGEDEPRA